MNSPRVTELPRRLEPVARDPFLERAVAGELVVLRPPAAREAAPPPPRAA
jgi:hypothetical protein